MYRLVFDALNSYDRDKWNHEVKKLLSRIPGAGYLKVSRNVYAGSGKRQVDLMAVLKIEGTEGGGIFSRAVKNISVSFRDGTTLPVFAQSFGRTVLSPEFLEKISLKEGETELGIYEKGDEALLEEDLRICNA